MTRSRISVLAALAIIALVAGATAAVAEDLEGEILDLSCYISKGAKGPAHTRCAQSCAEHGMPLGLLTGDDKIYILYPKHGKEQSFDEVKALAGTQAKLTGSLFEKDGLLGMEVTAAAPAK